jgi:cytochrome b involved in lipid metabolism
MEPFNKLRSTMTQNDFNELVADGHKLVILDELVLDVGSWVSRHPGGRFVIKQNIGRDISKYFHGG